MRCNWGNTNPLLTQYHDAEWGVPVHDDTLLFEFLVLDIFQAGLSWLTILKKREEFIIAFDNFNIKKIAAYNSDMVNELLGNQGIIRNRMKIEAVIHNARLVLEIQKESGSFDSYIWSFNKGHTIINAFQAMSEIPAKSDISDTMSRDLKKRGFKFVGSTICYAFMQSIGMVNDHITTCFRYEEIRKNKS
jgi:DNA-3-methyladenine glycosylase I